jgi:signal transduction histidine kinase
MRVRPYITEDKKIAGAVLSFSDVTEIKRLEAVSKNYTDGLETRVREQTEKLLDSEHFAAIGKTAGMVGHDIRNPIQAMVSELYLMKTELEALPDKEAHSNLQESIQMLEEQLFYINKIIGDLQFYSRPPFPNIEAVDLEDLVNKVVSAITIPDEIQVSITIEKNLPKLMLDHTYMNRILTNLVLNSLQSMPKGGTLEIIATCRDSKTQICIADTGDGMTDEVKKKIFSPLFTTKAKGQGFGLAVVKKLTEAMKGNINFESKKGAGTKFTLEFPNQVQCESK